VNHARDRLAGLAELGGAPRRIGGDVCRAASAGPLSGGQPASREADGGTRTPDPIITSDVLYQLSYVGAGPDGSDRSGA
jgi:hypothetical protein